jgi:hypothetical protein
MSGKDVDVNLDNIKVDIESDSYANVQANIDSKSNLDISADSKMNIDTSNIRSELVLPQPLRTESRFAITDPIVTQSSSELGLDIRPMVMDFCFKFEFGNLPSACIRQPYDHHFGIALFGIEILGLNFSGESRIVIDDIQKRPQVAWGGESVVHPKYGHRSPHDHDAGDVRIRLG